MNSSNEKMWKEFKSHKENIWNTNTDKILLQLEEICIRKRKSKISGSRMWGTGVWLENDLLKFYLGCMQ